MAAAARPVPDAAQLAGLRAGLRRPPAGSVRDASAPQLRDFAESAEEAAAECRRMEEKAAAAQAVLDGETEAEEEGTKAKGKKKRKLNMCGMKLSALRLNYSYTSAPKRALGETCQLGGNLQVTLVDDLIPRKNPCVK